MLETAYERINGQDNRAFVSIYRLSEHRWTTAIYIHYIDTDAIPVYVRLTIRSFSQAALYIFSFADYVVQLHVTERYIYIYLQLSMCRNKECYILCMLKYNQVLHSTSYKFIHGCK